MSSETATSPNLPGISGHSGRYFRGGTTYLPAALYGGEVVGSGRTLTSPTAGSGEVGRSDRIAPTPAAFTKWQTDTNQAIADGDLKPKELDLPERNVKSPDPGRIPASPEEHGMNEPTAVLNARTIGAATYLAASDVIAALRRRATEAATEAESYGDELDEDGFPAVVTWRTVAAEMNERADELQFAVIAHQAEDADAPDLKRVAKTVKGQFEDQVSVEPGRGSVYLQVAADGEHLTIALAPDGAEEAAQLLIAAAAKSRIA